MDIEKARTLFAELRGQRDVSSAELDEIWSALDTVRSADIVGSWKGDEFHTGHKMNGQLKAARSLRAFAGASPNLFRGGTSSFRLD